MKALAVLRWLSVVAVPAACALEPSRPPRGVEPRSAPEPSPTPPPTPPTGCGSELRECAAGQTRRCYPGPAGTEGRGVCRAGTQRCGSDCAWGDCLGTTLPLDHEVCGNSRDDDCNGVAEDGCRLCGGGLAWCGAAGCRVLVSDPRACGACGSDCRFGLCIEGACAGQQHTWLSLVWDGLADLDLRLRLPSGAEVSFQRRSVEGATLQRDELEGYGPEVIAWNAAPQPGRYTLCVDAWRVDHPVRFQVTLHQANGPFGATRGAAFAGMRTSATGMQPCTVTAPSYVGSFVLP